MKTLAEAFLKRPVTNAVLTVPACYSDCQRHAAKEAGKSAGWNILHLLNAPTSAAISARADQGTDADERFLVLDLGSSRAEATLLELWDCAFEERFTASDTLLGGWNYDEQLYQHFATQLDHRQQPRALLREACEQLKITLSVAQTVQFNIEPFTRDQFEDICGDLFKATVGLIEKVLLDAKVDKSSVKEVVLAGGLSRVPKVQSIICDFFGMQTVRLTIPNMACVRGAALYAASSSGSTVPYFGDFLLVLGIISYSVSIELRPGFHLLIFPRCTSAPQRSITSFDIDSNYLPQRLCLFDSQLKERQVLGTFDLSSLEFQGDSNHEHEFKLSVDIDPDGIMRASLIATNRSTGALVILPIERTRSTCRFCNSAPEQYMVNHQEKDNASRPRVQLQLSLVKWLCKSHHPREQLILKGAISQAEHWLQVHNQDNNKDGERVFEQLIQ